MASVLGMTSCTNRAVTYHGMVIEDNAVIHAASTLHDAEVIFTGILDYLQKAARVSPDDGRAVGAFRYYTIIMAPRGQAVLDSGSATLRGYAYGQPLDNKRILDWEMVAAVAVMEAGRYAERQGWASPTMEQEWDSIDLNDLGKFHRHAMAEARRIMADMEIKISIP
jgi:hypothetical protein